MGKGEGGQVFGGQYVRDMEGGRNRMREGWREGERGEERDCASKRRGGKGRGREGRGEGELSRAGRHGRGGRGMKRQRRRHLGEGKVRCRFNRGPSASRCLSWSSIRSEPAGKARRTRVTP